MIPPAIKRSHSQTLQLDAVCITKPKNRWSSCDCPREQSRHVSHSVKEQVTHQGAVAPRYDTWSEVGLKGSSPLKPKGETGTQQSSNTNSLISAAARNTVRHLEIRLPTDSKNIMQCFWGKFHWCFSIKEEKSAHEAANPTASNPSLREKCKSSHWKIKQGLQKAEKASQLKLPLTLEVEKFDVLHEAAAVHITSSVTTFDRFQQDQDQFDPKRDHSFQQFHSCP